MTQNISTADEYWQGMVEPDFIDYMNDVGDLRRAFHVASSLFHMTDWIWIEHQAYVVQNFTYENGAGVRKPVKDEKEFANSLAELSDDYSLIRAVANAGKHMKQRKPPSVQQGPQYAANVASQMVVGTVGSGALCDGPLSGGPISGGTITHERVIKLEGPADLRFDKIAQNARSFWITLRQTHNW